MSEILPIVLSGIQADLARAERAAMNLANSQTPGYKRVVAATAPFATQIETLASSLQVREASPSPEPRADLRPGTLKTTGQPLDLAIVGDGWFEVAIEGGTAYTRQGDFRLDAAGRLVTQQGHAVMGTSGVIHLLQGAPRIDAAGRVFDPQGEVAGIAAAPVAQIKVVQFEGAGPMQRLGGGLMQGGAALSAPEDAVQVRQGVLENSNVSPMREMVELMQAVRHLESMQKVAIAFDEMLATSIRKLGESS